MLYPTLKEDPSLLELTTKDDEIKTLKDKTEKDDFEKNLKSHKIDKEYYTKSNKITKQKIYSDFRDFGG